MPKMEDEHVSLRRGKWSNVGVPHKGWICIDIEDLGSPQVICEMCESQTLRYVHYMEHENYPDVLEVGCVCSGNMEGDINAARVRESSMRSRASKRKTWLSRKWKISKNGNEYIDVDGFRTTVYIRRGKWAATIRSLEVQSVQHSRKSYETIQQAKLSAFDQISRELSKSEN